MEILMPVLGALFGAIFGSIAMMIILTIWGDDIFDWLEERIDKIRERLGL